MNKMYYYYYYYYYHHHHHHHLGLGIRDGHRRLVSLLAPLPRLRVGLEGGAGQKEARPEGGVPDKAF